MSDIPGWSGSSALEHFLPRSVAAFQMKGDFTLADTVRAITFPTASFVTDIKGPVADWRKKGAVGAESPSANLAGSY